MPTVEQVEEMLRTVLEASEVTVTDISGNCGESFEVSVVSKLFAGKPVLARHRLVHGAMGDEMANIHALSIKKALTPEQNEAAAATAAAA
eukprot:CAMPEP_0197581780 /NCGR_PEP_ID=MMETSP1326-20131121/5186_1 /TAXON_ID=1155430 /ORGANISM="Genus nov. species nov., Strain RCC2288" /LENGTH=89 /DNA_ID=CAMNT_0043145731 /DNA_START=80 /DNA_END=346 /DNA_ORIENTATION=-